MKKALLLIVTIFMLCASTAVGAYTDVSSGDDYAMAVERLGTLGVLNGYEDNTFRPASKITREEFAKVIVCALDRKDEAMSYGYTSSFYDVTQGTWSVPYINYVAAGKVVMGYADGSFGPSNNITYGEAATIILRMMGYSEADLGYYWPNNYADKANSMLLAGAVVSDFNASITRSTAAIMIDNALFGNTNKNAVGRQNNLGLTYGADKTLLEAIGYTKHEDVFIVATKDEDLNLSANKVRTSAGTFELADGVTLDAKMGTAIVDEEKLKLFIPQQYNSMTVVIDKVTGNNVEYTSQTYGSGAILLDDNFTIYSDFEKTKFSTVAQASKKLGEGSTLTFYSDSSDGWSFATLDDNVLNILPVVATKDYSANDTSIEGIAIDASKLLISRNGKTASLSDIKMYDVLYLNKGAGILEVYSNKVTGIYYEAKPSKAYVTSVVIGNIEYNIATAAAKSKLDASPTAFGIGDRVTLLLGKDDEIVDVIQGDGNINSTKYGVVLNAYVDEDKSGAERYVAKILTGEAKDVEVITDKSYISLKGKLVRIGYNSKGLATLTEIRNAGVGGAVDKVNQTIGSYKIGEDTVIMELVSNNSGYDAEVEILDFATIEEKQLSEDNVLGIVQSDRFGDVVILYVEDWTDNGKEFGVVTSVANVYSQNAPDSVNQSQKQVSIYTADGEKTFNTAFSVKTGNAVLYSTSDGSIDALRNLKLVKTTSSVAASEVGRIKIGSVVYETSRNVLIVKFDRSTRSCIKLSPAQLEEKGIGKINLYAEAGSELIKVIIVE